MKRTANKLCSNCQHFKSMGKDEKRHHYCLKGGKSMKIDHFFIGKGDFCNEYEPCSSATTKVSENDYLITPVFGQWYDVNEHMPAETYVVDEDGLREYIPFLVTYLSFYDKKTPYCDAIAYLIDGSWRWSYDDEKVTVEITHWMALPKPAKRGEKK